MTMSFRSNGHAIQVRVEGRYGNIYYPSCSGCKWVGSADWTENRARSQHTIR
jgi:hypothetical protein